MASRRRRDEGAPHWSEQGSDPDYRFSLANERTFLAWIRTSLALLAGAVALKQLVPAFSVPHAREALSALLAGLGLAIATNAYRHWGRYEAAMRRGATLPKSSLMPWLSGLLALAAVVVAVVILHGTR